MSWRDSDGTAVRDLCESMGHEKVADVMIKKIQEGKFDLEKASLKELWEGFTGNAPLDSKVRMAVTEPKDKMEAVGTGSFIKVTGELINKKVIDAYTSTPSIGDELVTVVPTRYKKENIVGATDLELPNELSEHAPYDDSGFEEKYVTSRTKKWGRILSITEEMIYMDQVNLVVNRARMLGEGCRYQREKDIVEGVLDLNTTVYYPSDSATAVYSSANSNLQASNPFGAAGLATCLKAAHQMQSDSDSTKYANIDLVGKPLLVPMDLMEEAWELAESTSHPETAERAPNFWRGKFVPMTSVHITNQSATTWYWGDFKKAYWWMEIWPLQTFSAKPGHEDEFNKDIKAKYKVRYYGGIICVDPKYVFKNTA